MPRKYRYRLLNFHFLGCVIIVLFSILLLTSCSTKKNNIFSRSTHAILAEYNTIYNGYLELIKGDSIVKNRLHDNFWGIIPIEKMDVSEEIQTFDNEVDVNEFIIAEDKAVKAIQKHAMKIDDIERNPQMDEAFLLLGIARYYSLRFIQAQEAFNYIQYNYPASDKLPDVRVWKERTNIKLYNYQFAINNLHKIERQEIIDDKTHQVMYSSMAEAFYGLKKIDSTIFYLKKAINYTRDKYLVGRYLFIIGQLHDKQEYQDVSTEIYDKVIKLNYRTHRSYVINSYINKLKYTNKLGYNVRLENARKLRKLELVFENRFHKDMIQFHIGDIFYQNKQDSLAISYLSKSIQNSNDRLLKSFAYNRIADLLFKDDLYAQSAKYYDSILMFLPKRHPDYFKISKRRRVLVNVVKYENNVKLYDSIIGLVNMPDESRINYFEEYIRELKIREREQKERERKEREKLLRKIKRLNKGGFYFYNTDIVAFGEKEFKKQWEGRKYSNHWRVSTLQKSSQNTELLINDDDPNAVASTKNKYDVQYYIDKIPTDAVYIDSISKILNRSYYQLGIIYTNQFSNFGLSQNALNQVVANSKDIDLVLSAKYYLYKLYLENGNENNAIIIKKEILAQSPNSIYANMVSNEPISNNDLEKTYQNILRLFKDEEYGQVIDLVYYHKKYFSGNDLDFNLKLLKAIAVGKTQGKNRLKEELAALKKDYIKFNKEKGSIIVSNLLTSIHETLTQEEKDILLPNQWKITYLFDNPSDAKNYHKIMNNFITNRYYNFGMSVSEAIFNDKYQIITIHNIETNEVAENIKKNIKNSVLFMVNPQNFVISSRDYKKLLISKIIPEN